MSTLMHVISENELYVGQGVDKGDGVVGTIVGFKLFVGLSEGEPDGFTVGSPEDDGELLGCDVLSTQ